MREFSIFHLSKLEWDASKIGVKSNGGWAVFTDPITHKSLNSPRHPYPEPKIVYRRKTEEQLEQEEKIRKWREIKTKKKGNNFNNFSTVSNPLLNPPKDNYKEFRARKQLISSKNSNNEDDDFNSLPNGILTSRSMPRQPQKTVQFARDLQVTSLNTQRYSRYSPSSIAKCTPRSQNHYNELYEEEDIYEIDMNQNQTENEANTETDIIIETNDIEKLSEKIPNNDNFTNNGQIEITEDTNSEKFNSNIEITDKDSKSSKNNKNCESISLNDDFERIEIKPNLEEEEKNDDSCSFNSDILTEKETVESEEKKVPFQDEIKSTTEKGSKQWKRKRTGEVISRKRTVISASSSFNSKKSDNKNLNLTKNKTQETINDSKQSKFNHTHPNDKPIQFNFKYNHPNNLRKSEVPEDYKKTTNEKLIIKNRNRLNKHKSDHRYKKNKNDDVIIEIDSNKSILQNSENDQTESINDGSSKSDNIDNENADSDEKNTIEIDLNIKNEDSSNDDKENSTEINITNDKDDNHINSNENKSNDDKENSNEIESKDVNDNQNDSIGITLKEDKVSNDTIEIDFKEANDKDECQDDSIEITLKEVNDNDNNQNSSNVITLDVNEVDGKVNKQNNSSNNNDDQNHSIEISSNEINSEDNKESTSNEITTNDNDNEEENQNDSIEITTNENNNESHKQRISNDHNQSNDLSESHKDDTPNNNNNDDEDASSSSTDSFLTNIDTDDSLPESYFSTVSSSKTAKKASNVYGHNYNDYNYYNNVITANIKVNLASSAPFQFTSTRAGSSSSLGCEISHNLSPLPTTRRPATAVRQKFIERPECIGPERFFRGDDPAPARRFFQSANLVSEMRKEEEMKLLATARVKRNLSKTVGKKGGQSLYERSLKPREKRYCWPRDFAQFSVE